MIIAWLFFPLVMVAVCMGCGLLVEWLSGRRVPGALVPALGLFLIVVVSTLTTTPGFTAPWTTPIVLILAIAGLILARRRLRELTIDLWQVALALVLYAVFAAPVVLSGQATFLGYFVDGDTAFHLAIASQLASNGHNLSNVPIIPFSSIQILLQEYLGSPYPVGIDAGLAALRPLVGQDLAWIFQPYLAVIMVLGGLALDELLHGVVRNRPLRALSAFIAAQAGLAYAFYLESSIKELATTVVITVTAALVVAMLRRPLRPRALIPLAITVVAGLDILGIAVAPWLALPLVVFAGIAAWRLRGIARGRATQRDAAATAGVVVGALVLAIPALKGASTYVDVTNGVLSQAANLGNLATPLSHWQVLGVWPSGDFRFPVVTHYRLAFALQGVVIVGALLGGIWLVRRRAYGPLLLLVSSGLSAWILLGRSGPYAAAKVLMIVSIPIVLTAMLGAAALRDSGRRLEGWVVAALVAAGVLWTNFLAYNDSSIAPQARFRELAAIGSRYAGQGPAFYNLYDTSAVYFLRHVSPAVPQTWGAAVSRAGLPPRTGPQSNLPWDPNDLSQAYLQRFHLLILGRSPMIARPPANYRLIQEGRFYDVWERQSTPQVLDHISITGGVDPLPPPRCSALRQAGAEALRDHAQLAYVTNLPGPSFYPSSAAHPSTWAPAAANGAGASGVLALTQQPGTVLGQIRVPVAGNYRVWLYGSFSRPVTVWVGKRDVGSLSREISSPGQVLALGTVHLNAGNQPVQITRPPASGITPGNIVDGYAGTGELLGPVMLVPAGQEPQVHVIAPQQAASLCGKRLQWVEVIR